MALAEARTGTRNVLAAITVNLQKPTIRHETLEDRPYLVVPMVMLTAGVHSGSQGALYYPDDELARTAEVWNHKPIVVYHPQINGVGVSACDPVILSNRKIGLILGARYEDKQLKADAWLEEDRLKKVDPRILQALQQGRMVELSTGLFTDQDVVEGGEWRGERYVAVARNYRPDHLAILPDQVGACSIAKGAGLLRNQGELEMDDKKMADMPQPMEPKKEPAQVQPMAVPVTNQPPVVEKNPMTVNDYIAAAPPEIRDMLESGLRAHESEKAKLIGAITANQANVMSKEFLATKGLGELQAIAALATAVKPVENKAPSFVGLADVVSHGPVVEDPLDVPVLNFVASKQ